jgi:hypothetical protein
MAFAVRDGGPPTRTWKHSETTKICSQQFKYVKNIITSII